MKKEYLSSYGNNAKYENVIFTNNYITSKNTVLLVPVAIPLVAGR